MKMTPEARARLEARAEIEKWWGRWDRLWRRVGVELARARAVAQIAESYDALVQPPYLGRRPPPQWLLELALADYKLRFPHARGDRHYVTRSPAPGTVIANRAQSKMFDYCCRYCGRVLVTDPPGFHRHALPPQHEEHVARCAIHMLAGRLTPAPPGHNPHDPESLRLAVEQFAAVTRAVVLAWASDVVDDTMRRFAELEFD